MSGRKSNEYFINKATEYTRGSFIIPTGNIQRNKGKVLVEVRCLKESSHPLQYKTISHLKRKSSCSYCSKKSRRTNKEFLEYVNSLGRDDIKPTGNIDRTGNHTKIELMCTLDKEHPKWYATLAGIERGDGCKKCGTTRGHLKQVKDISQVKHDIYLAHGDRVKMIDSSYIGNQNIAKFKCGSCKNHLTWKATPWDVANGSGCPMCASSKAEQIIGAILEVNDIRYDYQVTKFINNKKHIFDFLLYTKNGNNVFVEADGEQHLNPDNNLNKFKSSNFYDRLARDLDKDYYAKCKGYKMIRIPYTKFNVNDISLIIKDAVGIDDITLPNVSYIPVFKRYEEMINYSVYHTLKQACLKYKVSEPTIRSRFYNYYGVTRGRYLVLHPEINTLANIKRVIKVTGDTDCKYFIGLKATSTFTKASISMVYRCLHGDINDVFGYTISYATKEEILANGY